MSDILLACPNPDCAVLNDPDQETCVECGKRLGLSDLMLRSLREAAASVPVPAASLSGRGVGAGGSPPSGEATRPLTSFEAGTTASPVGASPTPRVMSGLEPSGDVA